MVWEVKKEEILISRNTGRTGRFSNTVFVYFGAILVLWALTFKLSHFVINPSLENSYLAPIVDSLRSSIRGLDGIVRGPEASENKYTAHYTFYQEYTNSLLRKILDKSPNSELALSYLEDWIKFFPFKPAVGKTEGVLKDYISGNKSEFRENKDYNIIWNQIAEFSWYLENYNSLHRQTSHCFKCGKLPPIHSGRVNELKLYASMAASAYCTKNSLVKYDKVQCGFPRCSNPQLTLRSLGAAANITRKHISSDDDILADTRTKLYFKGPKSSMVGTISTNSILDFHASQDIRRKADLSLEDSRDKKTIIISFRGSLVPKNFLYDLKFAMVDFQYPAAPFGVKVHSGFWKVWKDVEAIIVDKVRSLIKENEKRNPGGSWYDFLIVGHSLGGTTALFCGLMLRKIALEHGFTISPNDISVRIYTFGEPRVGNSIFANWVMSLDGLAVNRITYWNDPIPHLPPRIKWSIRHTAKGFPWSLDFFHHAAEAFITKRGDMTLQCDKAENITDKLHSTSSAGEISDDETGEQPACSSGVQPYILNPLSHLTYWNIIFGPWC